MAGGTKVDLSDLIGAPPPAGARTPSIGRTARAVPTEQVAPNPLNTRVIDPDSKAVRDLADSIEAQGQLETSTVVTRAAFVAKFPEYEEQIGAAKWVQATGGQRRAACVLKGLDLEIAVKDELAESRARFVTATATENLKRNDYNAIEEAEAIARIVKEHGDNQSAAARELGKSQPWVHQRLNVLKLAPEVLTYLRTKPVPVREIRGTLYKRPAEEQLAVVQSLVNAKERAITAVLAEPGDVVPPQRARASRIEVALRRLEKAVNDLADSKSIPEIGATLRAKLPREDRRALAEDLLRDEAASGD